MHDYVPRQHSQVVKPWETNQKIQDQCSVKPNWCCFLLTRKFCTHYCTKLFKFLVTWCKLEKQMSTVHVSHNGWRFRLDYKCPHLLWDMIQPPAGCQEDLQAPPLQVYWVGMKSSWRICFAMLVCPHPCEQMFNAKTTCTWKWRL